MKNTILVQQLHLINTMATVDSLDLASLQNNPQSIAEALEDALETTDGTIGTLKTSAQTKKDDIDDLYDDALTAKNNIDSILNSVSSVEEFRTNSLSDSWIAWDHTLPPSNEDGLHIQRYGKLYICHLSCYKANVPTASATSSVIRNIASSDMTHPSQEVEMGMGSPYFGTAQHEIIVRVSFETNGNLKIYMLNTGSTFHCVGTFVGIDHG